MRILIIVDSLALGGGAEKYAVNLGNKLYTKGYYVFYLTFFDENPKYEFKGEYFSFKDKYKRNAISRIWDLVMKPFKIRNICKDNNIDVIISIGEVANLHAIMSKFLFKIKSKIVISQVLNPKIHFKSRITFHRYKFFYPKADKVVCISEGIKRILERECGIKNTVTIYNMLDLDSCLKLSNENLPEKFEDIFDSDFIFVTIGRLSVQKGQWFLIRSFKSVVNKHKNVKLCIIGEGELKQKLTKLVKKLDLEDKVFFLGNQKNIFPFLKKSDCFVLSSLVEGFPTILIETLAVDIPIISTDCKTGPKECLCPDIDPEKKISYPYYGKYGILTVPFDVEFLIKKIEEEAKKAENMLEEIMIKMIENPKLRKRYSNGLKRAEEFDKERIIDKWENLLIITKEST